MGWVVEQVHLVVVGVVMEEDGQEVEEVVEVSLVQMVVMMVLLVEMLLPLMNGDLVVGVKEKEEMEFQIVVEHMVVD